MERRYIHEHSDTFGKKTGACIKRAKNITVHTLRKGEDSKDKAGEINFMGRSRRHQW